MSEEREKEGQRHSGLLKLTWELLQQGAGEVDTYKRDRLEGEGEMDGKREEFVGINQHREKERKQQNH